jgi:hypothetical protein
MYRVILSASLTTMTLVRDSNFAIAIENGTQIETREGAACSATDAGLARQLGAAIDKRYEELAGARALTGNPHGNDIANVVLPYIHQGMSFNDSERILHCAGFTIRHPDPTTPTVNRSKDWYAVLAIIAPYVRRRHIGRPLSHRPEAAGVKRPFDLAVQIHVPDAFEVHAPPRPLPARSQIDRPNNVDSRRPVPAASERWAG